MKRYKKYMNNIKASDTLRQRLRELKAPAKRSARWKGYSSIAAALVLVLGLGGSYYYTQVDSREAFLEYSQVWAPPPDTVTESPSEAERAGLGGYEYYDPRFEGMHVVSFAMLPYIDYGTSNENAEQNIAMDWAIQEGAVERELTQEEIVALLGGADTVSTHLDWDAYELTGRMWERPDGSMLLAFLYGYQGPLDHFEFAVMDGELPPTCIAYAGSVTQEVRGLTVTADKFDGEYGCDRRVSFMKDNYGYRFDLTSTDTEQAERLVSRLVCCVADERLALPYTCPDCGVYIEAGVKHDHTQDDGGDTPGYAPAVSADPYICTDYPVPAAPAVSAEPIAECGMPDADEPPTMRVKCGGDSLVSHPSSYQWSYSLKNGETSCVIACGTHPLDFWEAPSLTTTADTAKLSLSGSVACVEAECWPESQRGNDSASGETLSMARNSVTQNYELELKQGGWIYQVSAHWENGDSAEYVFYITKN